MEVNTINVLALAVRYSPPTLLIHYHSPADRSRRFVHQVKVYIKPNATAALIADELIRKEELYLRESNVSRDKIEFLIQMLIENRKKVSLVSKTPTYTISVLNSFKPTIGKEDEGVGGSLGSKRLFEPESTLGSMPRVSSREEAKNRDHTASNENLQNSEDYPNVREDIKEDKHASNSNNEGEDANVVIAETAEGETIRLQKIVIEDINREVLLDEEGNLYDLEGHFLGELEEDQPSEEQTLPEFQKRIVESRGKGMKEVNLN